MPAGNRKMYREICGICIPHVTYWYQNGIRNPKGSNALNRTGNFVALAGNFLLRQQL
jgi:hypothetical protein